jgi:hypothetical protein
MEKKNNCWEVKKCGREPGGERINEFGICPAAIEEKVTGINDGKNGGRCCWGIAGTFCNEEIQGIFAKKMLDCVRCEFYQMVKEEEGSKFVFLYETLMKLGKEHIEGKESNKNPDKNTQ